MSEGPGVGGGAWRGGGAAGAGMAAALDIGAVGGEGAGGPLTEIENVALVVMAGVSASVTVTVNV